MCDSRHPILVLAALVAFGGCEQDGATKKCEDPAQTEARLRAEIRAQIQAELGQGTVRSDSDGLVPKSALSLGKGEKSAITSAQTELNQPKPLPTSPTLSPVAPPGGQAPSALTSADKRAIDDDPAARPIDTPVVEWPTEDDGDKPAPSAKAVRAPHIEPARNPDQVDTSKLRQSQPAGSQASGAPRPEAAPAASDSDEATRQAERDDPARVAGNDGDGGRQLRVGVYAYPARDGLAVVDLAIAERMQGRQPFNISDNYATPPALLACFGAYSNRGQEAQITHVWRKGDKLLSRVELRVGVGPKWRTWSRQRVRGGNAVYSCEVLSPSGKRLGIARATVGGGEAAP